MKTLNLKEHGEREGGYDELIIWDNKILKLLLIHKHETSGTLTITVKDYQGNRLTVHFIIPLKGYYEKYSLLQKRWDEDCKIYEEMSQH